MTRAHDFSAGSHDEVMRLRIANQSYKAYVNPAFGHPSNWTFTDEHQVRVRWWNIKRGDVVLDIGAEYGSYTLTALAQGAKFVMAWAPSHHVGDPIEAHVLARSLQLNGWEDKANVLSEGLWSKPGWLVSYDNVGKRPQFFESPKDAHAEAERVGTDASVMRVTTLDDNYVFDRVDWIKIDTEGAEEQILRGGAELIQRCRPNILLEHHLFIDPGSAEREAELLKSWGYTQHGPIKHSEVSHSLFTHEGEPPFAA